MITLWFWLLTLTFTVYVVLDGFDIGVGLLHLGIARDGIERHALIKSVAPVWDGNEVWLIVGGGTLFAAFPLLFAALFSGFYLPLMIFLWLLALRALGIELQHQLEDPMWLRFWDYVFFSSSWLIALLLGAAVGCVIRGVPLAPNGSFFLPLWTNLQPQGQVGVLDAYTVLTALTAVAVLALHGLAWLNLRLDGSLQAKIQGVFSRVWVAAVALVVLSTLVTLKIQPRALDNIVQHPAFLLFPLASALGFTGVRKKFRKDRSFAFAASCLALIGLMGSAACAIWPFGIPSSLGPGGILLSEAAADEASLATMLLWWIPGISLVCFMTYFVYSRLPQAQSRTEHS